MKVFLGGTCSGRNWRDELIPLLKCEYYNPIVKNWSEEDRIKEVYERKTSDYVLYAITNDIKGVYSIAEVVDDSNKRPEKTLFVNLYEGDKQMEHSLKATENLLKENGVRIFNNLKDVADFLNEEIMEKWIDSHCHYEHGIFKRNRDSVLNKVDKYCEKVICVGTNLNENKGVIDLSHKYDFIYNMVGFFPTSVDKIDEEYCSEGKENWNNLILQLQDDKNVGLGEIGLDYSWNQVGKIKGEEAQELQKKWFRKQIILANELNKPISIHSRDAEEDTKKILDEFEKLNGVVHCFSYSPKTAKFFIDKGLYLGIGGTSTYKFNDKIREAIRITPIEKILLETDAPYLSPEPVRRTVNDSSNIIYVIKLISQLKCMTEEEVIKQTNENCKNLYNF